MVNPKRLNINTPKLHPRSKITIKITAKNKEKKTRELHSKIEESLILNP